MRVGWSSRRTQAGYSRITLRQVLSVICVAFGREWSWSGELSCNRVKVCNRGSVEVEVELKVDDTVVIAMVVAHLISILVVLVCVVYCGGSRKSMNLSSSRTPTTLLHCILRTHEYVAKLNDLKSSKATHTQLAIEHYKCVARTNRLISNQKPIKDIDKLIISIPCKKSMFSAAILFIFP